MQSSVTGIAYRQLHICFALAAILFILLIQPLAAAEGRRASMVIDANTGQILHAQSADAPRYPASLTKMMTLYMLFEQIDSGRTSLSSLIRISPYAASAQPSKLGLDAGEQISVRDAIQALVVKSANDIAIAVAEHVGGTEAAFAAMMTERARAIGMSNTTFRNASGLPNPGQTTTARDMLTLALRLHDDFPTLYPFFSTRAFTYAGRTYRTHNSMMGTYPGMEGLKTGYIRASGFNLVSSVKRGDRHVVAAVFGGTTAATRNAEMRAILGRTLPRASTVKTRKPAPRLMARAKPITRAKHEVAAAPPAPVPVPMPVVVAQSEQPSPHQQSAALSPTASGPNISMARVRTVTMAQPSSPAPLPSPIVQQVEANVAQAPRLRAEPALARENRGMAPSTFQQQAANLARGSAPVAPLAWETPQDRPLPQRAVFAAASMASAARPAPASASAASNGPFQIQVGAFGTAAEAEKALVSTLERSAGLLSHAAPVTLQTQSGSRQLYRARFSGFNQQAASNTCSELKRRQIDCFVTRSE